jgi:hypothetical protein
MKNNKLAFFGVVGLIMSLCAWSAMAAEGPNKTQREKGSWKTAGTPRYAVLSINNLTTWHRSDGQSNHSPQADNGLYYPRGTGNLIYQDGVVYGGKAYLDAGLTQPAPRQLVRVNGGTYGVGTRAGYVNGFGATAVPADPAAPDVRIYRIRRDYRVMTKDELRLDAAAVNEIKPSEVTDAQMQDVLDQYAKDWDEWPVAKGAPFIDRNGNGVFDRPPAFSETFTVDSLIAGGYDEPGVAGSDLNSPADQVIFTVYNDLHEATATSFQFSEPLGIEIQKTVWGYKRSDAMGNLYFSRYKLINKGGVDIDPASGLQAGAFYIDSMFVCQWSDPDLGSFSDDLVGCDPARSLGFVYNGNAVDATYRAYSLPPPSAGYDFLAGPLVTGAPSDSGVRFLKRVYGKKNLGMSSFAFFSAGSPYSDPCNAGTAGYACNTGQWWKMLRGFAPLGTIATSDQPYANAAGYPNPKFPLSGDPVAGTGWLDGRGDAANSSFAPGDRRILLNTGPFTMAPGDTQEVYVGLVVGLGGDRLSSVAVMKANDNAVQLTFDLLFQVSRPPAPPNVVVTELDGQVILEWGSDLNRVRETETRVSQPGQYEFEGYNVYQLPSRGSRLEEAVRIVTYDLPTEPRVIFDTRYDLASGQFIQVPVQFGSNSGINRSFLFKRDYVLDVDKIYNGQEYYLVVTAYSHAKLPGFTAALESSPNVITVRPKVPFGVTYRSHYGDTLNVTLTTAPGASPSDGQVIPLVVNPAAVTGNTYRVNFVDSNFTWKVTNQSTNVLKGSGFTNQSGDGDYPIIDGILVKVIGPPPGMKDWSIPKGNRRVTFADADGLGFEGFEGTIGWDDPAHYFGSTAARTVPASQLKNVVLRWGQASPATTSPTTNGFNPYGGWDRDNSTDPNMSYGYRYLRAANVAAPARPEFAPYILVSGSYSFQDYKISVPLSAWNVEADVPQRLAVGFLENNVAGGLVDGRYYPPSNGNGQNNTAPGGPREWLFIFNKPYTGSTPDASLQLNILTNGLPVMWWASFNRRANDLWDEPTGTNEFMIHANHVNSEAHTYTFTAPTYDRSATLEKVSAEKIGVFPNPYYAFNAAETNRFDRFVTFNNLPPKAKIRIFNLAGQLVRVIEKNDASQFVRWSLTNTANYPVASGIYIAYVEATLPTTGEVITKTLKFAIIQEQEILNTY